MQEGGHDDLVGGVEDAGEGTALCDAITGEGQQGEDLGIGAAEGELTEGEEIGLLQSSLGGETAGMGQGVLDAMAHIRHRHLGNDAMVNIFHHGVDHALAVDDDLHLVGRHTEEMHRLDDLEALVHEGGGIHRDLGAHLPGGVSQGHGLGDGLQLFLGVAVEGASRGGQQDAADLVVMPRAEALEDGAMLRVHGEDGGSLLSCEGHDQLTAYHQRFLIGQS